MPGLQGTGRFITYSGRDGGPCFKCKGNGNISKGQNAAIKGKATKEANKAKWAGRQRGEIAYTASAPTRAATTTLLPRQADRVRHPDRGSGCWSTRTWPRMLSSSRARGQSGGRPPGGRHRAPSDDLRQGEREADSRGRSSEWRLPIETDRVVGRQTSVGHGTEQGKYVGKVESGKFNAFRAATTRPTALEAVAADPTGAAISYARKIGACCCCGDDSQKPGQCAGDVGPICGPAGDSITCACRPPRCCREGAGR